MCAMNFPCRCLFSLIVLVSWNNTGTVWGSTVLLAARCVAWSVLRRLSPVHSAPSLYNTAARTPVSGTRQALTQSIKQYSSARHSRRRRSLISLVSTGRTLDVRFRESARTSYTHSLTSCIAHAARQHYFGVWGYILRYLATCGEKSDIVFLLGEPGFL